MNNTTQTIDCTPTWSGILPVIVALIQNPNTRKDGIIELQRMAELADAYVAKTKTNQKLPTMKKFITSVAINIEIDAQNQEEAEAKFFDLFISFKTPLDEEADWTFINQETFEA
jgi:hypothetical protein